MVHKTNIKPIKHGLKKFIILCVIITMYAAFLIMKFGITDGIGATLLTWAFFVMCTPIADAGFLVDFPVRLLLGVKMIFSELIVWAITFIIIIVNLLFNESIFNTLPILQLFYTILTNPWPLWSIIILSGVGTFLSIYVGDIIYTMVQEKHHHKHIKRMQIKRLLADVAIFFIILLLYMTFLHMAHIEM